MPAMLTPRRSPEADATRRLLVLAAVMLGAAALLGHGGVDAEWLQALNAVGRTLPWWWAQVTMLGTGAAVVVVDSMLVAFAGPGRERLALALLASVPLAGLLTHGAKALVGLPRPAAVFTDGQLHVIGHALTSATGSMPSGHALAAAALAALWWLASAHRGQRRLVVAIALLVAASRVVVGAHWPSDVLAGAALGIVAAVIAWRLSARPLDPGWRRTLERTAIVALPALAGAALLVGGTEQPQADALRSELALLGLATAVVHAAGLDARRARRRVSSRLESG